ncbi:MAG TPA: polyamine aminopropyltransferase [candidate division Zixibacteria bacterium]|nr:polyamine aminopropyltransferase [candidate division Zixibacteria bacterium]
MSQGKPVEETYIREEGMDDLWNVWYTELHDGLSGLTIKVDRVLKSIDSRYQRIDVLDTKDFGKMLVLYGSLMVSERDNNAYNEMISHVPLFVHPSPKQVLIIGGGDCGALTEALKHPEVEQCTMCELDEKVVDTAKEFFPDLCAGTADPRANIVFGDGKKFIERTDRKFDLIMLDLSDPVGPAAELFQRQFHQKVFECLEEDGILVAQSESPFYNQKTVKALFSNFKKIFPIVRMYTCFMPIYPSTYWSFGFCSKKYDPIADFDRDRWEKLGLKTRYYNAETHVASFALPQFVKELVG